MNEKYQEGLVSVIIPCFNAATYLPRAIDSALNQTYSNLEVLVIDDGSTDNTKDVVKPYLNEIHYVYKKNGGPASARNIGISNSNGEYLAFLDADDYWLPEKLEIQVSILKNEREYGLVHGNLFISESRRELYPPFIEKIPPSGKVFEQLFLDNFIYNLTVVIRRNCIEKVGCLDESNELIGIEDYDLWLRIALYFQVAFIDKIVAVYNRHETNLSNETNIITGQQSLVAKIASIDKVKREHPGIVKEKNERLAFRLACWLMEREEYKKALKKFILSSKRSYLKFHSIIGILSCLIKSNILFKSRAQALAYKQYGMHFLRKKDYKRAKKYFLQSLRNYPLQRIALNYIVLLAVRRP